MSRGKDHGTSPCSASPTVYLFQYSLVFSITMNTAPAPPPLGIRENNICRPCWGCGVPPVSSLQQVDLPLLRSRPSSATRLATAWVALKGSELLATAQEQAFFLVLNMRLVLRMGH